MSEIPDKWSAPRLDQITLPPDYGLTASADPQANGPLFLRITDIQDGRVDWSKVPRCECENVDRFKLSEGDIVVARTGATTGKSFQITHLPDQTVFASYLVRIRGSAELNPNWLKHYLDSPGYWLQIEENKSGSAQPGVNASKLAGLIVPLAPCAEQNRIVAKLESLRARSSRARHELDHIPKLIEHYKQAILAKAFSGELTADWRARHKTIVPVLPRKLVGKAFASSDETTFEPPFQIPEGWTWLKLPELGELDRGRSRHRPRNDPRLFGGAHPFVQTGEVRAAKRYLTHFEKTYSEFGLAQSRLWPIGTVCITIAANIAETAILGLPACFPDSVVGFSADYERTIPEYIEYFIRTVRADLEQFAPATAQKNINLETLYTVRVPSPPLAEQRQIVQRLDQTFAWLEKIAAEHARANYLLPRLDQAILAKAFRGELVQQDPNDEPASELLARIAASSEAPKPRTRRKKESA